MRKNIFIYSILACFLFACTSRSSNQLPDQVSGYVPIYSSSAAAKTITAGPARATVKGGKLYTVGNLLFQVEADSGIHVINYSNPASPQKLGFIRSALCKEISVKDGYIYTNNLSDLV